MPSFMLEMWNSNLQTNY